MIKITSEKEKEHYFTEQIKKDGAYFNVKYPSGETEFIWVKQFKNWNEDGSSWHLEAPNCLMKYDNISLEPYYDEEEDETYESPFIHCYIEGNVAYEIDSPQTSPFLPEEFEIEFVTDEEIEAVKYMIEREKQSNNI